MYVNVREIYLPQGIDASFKMENIFGRLNFCNFLEL